MKEAMVIVIMEIRVCDCDLQILKITDSYLHFTRKIRKEIWKQGSLWALPRRWVRSMLKRAKKLRPFLSLFPISPLLPKIRLWEKESRLLLSFQ